MITVSLRPAWATQSVSKLNVKWFVTAFRAKNSLFTRLPNPLVNYGVEVRSNSVSPKARDRLIDSVPSVVTAHKTLWISYLFTRT